MLPATFYKEYRAGFLDNLRKAGCNEGIKKPGAKLQEDEKLTCGVYSPSGHNFVIGTSFGSIYIGNMKRDPMSNRNQFNLFLARIDRVVHDTENAVTSIQMTS